MTDNKKDGKLDFRNVKKSQFGGSQIERMEFSELNSAKRVVQTNQILKDPYTHFTQILDASNRPTKVSYYQALDSTIDKLTFRADNSGDLAGTYYTIENPIDQKLYVIYQVVDGNGNAPGIGDVEIPANIQENDSAVLVAYTNRIALRNIDDIKVLNKAMLDNFAEIEYIQFGEADSIDLGTTGFTVQRSKVGDSRLVGEVEMSYDSDGNIIYQDQLLKNATYDSTKGEFVFPIVASLKDPEGNPFGPDNPLSVQLSDGSVNIGTVNAELEVQLSRKDNDPDNGDVHDAVRIGNQDVELGFTDLEDGSGEAKVQARTHVQVDNLNSTSTPLLASESFVGPWVRRTNPIMIAAVSTDTDLDFRMEFSTDGVTAVDSSLPYTYKAGEINVPRRLVIAREFYRINATNNSGTDQTFLRFQTSVGDFPSLASKLNASLSLDADAEVVRSIQTGLTAGEEYINLKADSYVPAFSSNTPLGPNETFETGIVDVSSYNYVASELKSDVDGSLTAFFYDDEAGTTELRQFTRPYTAGEGLAVFGSYISRPYVKYVFTNGPTAQTQFHIASKVLNQSLSGQILGLEDFVPNNIIVPVTRSVATGKDPNGVYLNQGLSGRVNDLSTESPLIANATFTSPVVSAKGFVGLDMSVNSDQIAAPFGIKVRWYADEAGTQLLREVPFSYNVVTSTGEFFAIPVQGDFVQVTYTNGNVDQTQMYLETQLTTTSKNAFIGKLDTEVSGGLLGLLTQSVIKGETPNGDFRAFPMGGKDSGNSTNIPLAANGTFTGEYQRLDGHSSGFFFAFSNQPLDQLRVAYSDDGINPVSGTLVTGVDLIPTQVEIDGFFTYIKVINNFTSDFYRIEAVNGPNANFIFEVVSTLKADPYTGSFVSVNDTIDSLSTTLLTRSVIAGTDPVGKFKNIPSAGNAYTFRGTLLADATDVSQIIDAEGYGAFSIVGFADVNGEIDITWSDSADMSTNVASASFPVKAGGPRTLHLGPPQGKFVQISYQNGPTDSGTDQIYYAFDLSPSQIQLPLFTLGADLALEQASIIAKGPIEALDDTNSYGQIGRELDALKVSISNINAEISQAPSNGIFTTQLNVPSGESIQIPTPPASKVAKPRSVTIKNMCADIDIYLGDSEVTTQNGDIIQQFPEKMEFGDNGTGYEDLFLIAEQGAGNETFTELQADTIDSNTSVINPTNIFTLNSQYAVFDNNSDSLTISGFDSSILPATEDIQSVFLKAVARKEVGADVETSQLVDVVGQDAGNVTSITSPTVTANADHFYVVAVSRRDEFALVNSITNNMGFTGATLIGDTGTSSSESRTSLYYMNGTPTNNGTISANMSQGADHIVISVTRFSGVNLSNPVNSVTTFGADSSGGDYSGSLTDGTDKGQFYVALGFEQGSHNTASSPSGAAERFEDGSTASNDQVQSVITANLITDGAVNFSGTTNGNADITYVAASFNPSPSLDPIATISHSEGTTTLPVQAIGSTNSDFSVEITNDTIFDETVLDNMTLTIDGTNIGSASIEFDYVYLEIFTSNSTTRVAIKWIGDKP